MKAKVILSLGMILITCSLLAQDADQIIDKYYESIGGLEKWRELKTMKITAMVDMIDIKVTEITYLKAPNHRRYESKSEEGMFIQTFDGKVGWEKDPYMNNGDPYQSPPEIVEELKIRHITGDLIDYERKECTISYEATEVIDDIETYKIKLVKSNMELEYFYFDIADHLLVMSKKYEEMLGEMEETYYKDYRTIDGYKLPFLIESKLSGNLFNTTRIHEYLINEEIPDDMFRLY